MRLIDNNTYHVPVLLKESVDGLSIHPGGVYVDVTFGGGGHSKEILSRIADNGHLYSFDQDADAEQNVIPNEHFTFVCSNFRYLKNWTMARKVLTGCLPTWVYRAIISMMRAEASPSASTLRST